MTLRLLMKYLLFYCIHFNVALVSVNRAYELKCELPEHCRLKSVMDEYWNIYNDKGKSHDFSIMCDIRNNDPEFKLFKFSQPLPLHQKCNDENITDTLYIIFRWTNSKVLTTIFDKRFNFTNAMRFFSYLNYPKDLGIWDVNGFDVKILEEEHLSIIPDLDSIIISNSQLDLYHDKKLINSCQNMADFNITRIESIFQILTNYGKKWRQVFLRNIDYKHSTCPCFFKNTKITTFLLQDLVDTFYKKNVLSFWNETCFSNINSNIIALVIKKAYNINLDKNLLHPSVFNATHIISISFWSLNSIDEDVFTHLNKLTLLKFTPNIFRKINHKQGIGWMKKINYGLNVNLSQVTKDFGKPMEIALITSKYLEIGSVFPYEDFCLYVDFPFNQLVFVYEMLSQDWNKEFTCTYFWLARYYEFYIRYIFKFYGNFHVELDYMRTVPTLMSILNSTNFKLISSKCDFEKRINLCNKSRYQIKDFWDEGDFFILNKKLQTAFKIPLYPVSFIGLITNFIIVLVILHKDNIDLFKGFKQYSYLWLNSIFCMMILVIELLSWMTECFYPFEVFCSEIRKLVVIQYFKIIFKECLVTTFIFMCNFTYIAFAFNRISLIGKDHGKLVTFMSKLGVKKYIGVTIFISLTLSWIKFFKYEINYFYPSSNFPMSSEMDIMSTDYSRFNDFYFTFNSISDLVNYFVFVIICIVYDGLISSQLKNGEAFQKREKNNF